jgi:hypothetical protein
VHQSPCNLVPQVRLHASAPVDQGISPSSAGTGVAETDSELRSISKRRRLLQKHPVEIPMDDAVHACRSEQLPAAEGRCDGGRRPAVVLEECTAAGSLETGCKTGADEKCIDHLSMLNPCFQQLG